MASNFYDFKITRKLLQNYFGSAFRELGTVFIVITIRTKFPDITQIHSGGSPKLKPKASKRLSQILRGEEKANLKT